jgi:hypothetical protein
MSIEPHARYEWGTESIESLKALYTAGHGCRAIATALPGFSYAAVERRIRRLIKAGELEKREAVPFQGNPESARRAVATRKEHRTLEPAPEAIGPLNEIAGPNEQGQPVCQYIEADHLSDEGARMCGHPGYPWCDHHRKVVYQQRQQTPQERAEAAQKSLEALHATFGKYAMK